MKRQLLKLLFAFLSLAAILALALVITFRLLNRTNGSLISNGEKRTYLLYVPASYDPSTPTPLVISIHGYAEWPAHQMQTSRWNDLADRNGFLVVYPSGTRFPMRWRTSGEPGSAQDPAIDVDLIADLIALIQRDYNVDPWRIYANGLSNGGGMSFLLSCELADQIAAVGMVSGAYLYSWERCRPARPVPAVIFHGTADEIVPFEGGPSRAFDVDFPVVRDWVSELALRNGCSGSPLELPITGAVTGTRYQACNADVDFYVIQGGGHTWPGGVPLPQWIAGLTSKDVDATALMWNFFQAHPLPQK